MLIGLKVRKILEKVWYFFRWYLLAVWCTCQNAASTSSFSCECKGLRSCHSCLYNKEKLKELKISIIFWTPPTSENWGCRTNHRLKIVGEANPESHSWDLLTWGTPGMIDGYSNLSGHFDLLDGRWCGLAWELKPPGGVILGGEFLHFMEPYHFSWWRAKKDPLIVLTGKRKEQLLWNTTKQYASQKPTLQGRKYCQSPNTSGGRAFLQG